MHLLTANKSLLIFFGLMMVFRSAVADWMFVPSGSMNPTIVEGDRILVDKSAYGLRVPFTTFRLTRGEDRSAATSQFSRRPRMESRWSNV
jgi:signal peptidase I